MDCVSPSGVLPSGISQELKPFYQWNMPLYFYNLWNNWSHNYGGQLICVLDDPDLPFLNRGNVGASYDDMLVWGGVSSGKPNLPNRASSPKITTLTNVSKHSLAPYFFLSRKLFRHFLKLACKTTPAEPKAKWELTLLPLWAVATVERLALPTSSKRHSLYLPRLIFAKLDDHVIFYICS